MSTCDLSLPMPLCPAFDKSSSMQDSAKAKSTISALNLRPHIEGGYFVETDKDPYQIPNPFMGSLDTIGAKDSSMRNLSSSIYYMLTLSSPQGHFHRNKSRTVHTLHSDRGRYVIVHANELTTGQPARMETFVVGHAIEKGERLQWVVEGGKYKASYLLPDDDGGTSSDGLLISETVVPGFEYRDHDFLSMKTLSELVSPEQARELAWLVRDDSK